MTLKRILMRVVFNRRVSRLIVKLSPPSERFFTRDLTLLDRIVRVAVERSYYSMSEQDIRRFNRENIWGSAAGKGWYDLKQRQYQENFASFIEARSTLLSLIQSHITPEYSTICEIGTGAGMFLDYLSREVPGVRRFIGLDLNREQILENRITYPDLEFVHAEAISWIREHGHPGILFVATGTLEYFTQLELQELLKDIPSAIVIRDAHCDEAASMPRGGMGYAHNYTRLLAESGFGTIHAEKYHGNILIFAHR